MTNKKILCLMCGIIFHFSLLRSQDIRNKDDDENTADFPKHQFSADFHKKLQDIYNDKEADLSDTLKKLESLLNSKKEDWDSDADSEKAISNYERPVWHYEVPKHHEPPVFENSEPKEEIHVSIATDTTQIICVIIFLAGLAVLCCGGCYYCKKNKRPPVESANSVPSETDEPERLFEPRRCRWSFVQKAVVDVPIQPTTPPPSYEEAIKQATYDSVFRNQS